MSGSWIGFRVKTTSWVEPLDHGTVSEVHEHELLHGWPCEASNNFWWLNRNNKKISFQGFGTIVVNILYSISWKKNNQTKYYLSTYCLSTVFIKIAHVYWILTTCVLDLYKSHPAFNLGSPNSFWNGKHEWLQPTTSSQK